MCRLLAIIAPEPRSVRDTLGAAQLDHLINLAKVHGDGWGTVWIDEDGALRRHVSPHSAAHDAAFAEAMLQPARARLVHLRFATADLAVIPENTHPFRHGDLTLAHNGSIIPVDRLRPLVSPHQREWVQGTTDSELYLALIQQQLDEGAADLATAAQGAIATIRTRFPTASLNAMMLTPDQLVVVRSSTHALPPLGEIDQTGAAHFMPPEHQEHYFRLWYRGFDDGAVAVASTGLESAGWTKLGIETITTWQLADQSVSVTGVSGPALATPA